ncbi:hypothetical protein GGI18_002862 [Coemansia linderi]|uniref:Uncharacterized protein n=1 Tax=Coemansia linderi TaxID=2663919 RepID=A0ACC1KEC6_9FUNG|nr:hypothetical protein GGI18_002862 [Coemansia linderi]
MNSQNTFAAFKQRALQPKTTTRVVVNQLAKARQRNQTKRAIRDIKLLTRFDRELKAEDTKRTSHLYSRLVKDNRAAPLDPIFGNKLPVVARRSVNATSTHLPQLHSKVLGLLQPKLMHGYMRQDVDWLGERARQVVEQMGRSRLELTGDDVSNLLSCFVGNTGAVDQVWQYATLSGVVRNIDCYNNYLNAKIFAKDYERAFHVLEEIAEAGLQPNVTTQAYLIRLYGLTGDLAAARRVFEQASGEGSVVVYNDMLDVLGMNGLVEEMRQLFLDMTGLASLVSDLSKLTADDCQRAQGAVAPNRKTFHILIKWHSQYWDVDTAANYVRVMSEAFHIQPVAKTFKLIISPQTAVREFQKCASIGVLMGETYDITPPGYIVRTLERAAKQIADMEEMVRKSEAQRSSIFYDLFGSSSESATSASQ